MTDILSIAKEYEEKLIAMRRELHSIPEIDVDEDVLYLGVASYLAIVSEYLGYEI